MLREKASEGRHTKHNHRKLVNLITQITASSNSMKLSHGMWGHPRRVGHGGDSARMFLSVFFLLWFYGNQTHQAAFCSLSWVPRSPAKWPELIPLSNPACPSPIKEPEWEMMAVCKPLSQQKQSEGKDKAKLQHHS